MSNNKYIAETCEVTCENNNKKVTADILSFKEHASLSVSIDKSVKVNLQWNGRIYEGKMSGLSFISTGPTIRVVNSSRN